MCCHGRIATSNLIGRHVSDSLPGKAVDKFEILGVPFGVVGGRGEEDKGTVS